MSHRNAVSSGALEVPRLVQQSETTRNRNVDRTLLHLLSDCKVEGQGTMQETCIGHENSVAAYSEASLVRRVYV